MAAGVMAGAAFLGRGLTASAAPAAMMAAGGRADATAARALFHDKGCEFCHGVNGVGGEKGPNLSGVGRRLKPDAIRTQIEQGGGGMPSFADALTPEETTTLVDWLKTRRQKPPKQKRGAAKTPEESAPPTKHDDDSGRVRTDATESVGL